MVQGQASLASFDGSADFAGASGVVLGELAGQASAAATLRAASTSLVPFIGTGSVALTATAAVRGSETGPANVLERFQSDADAVVTLQYDYVAASTISGGGNFGSGGVATVDYYGFGLSVVEFASLTTVAQTATIAPRSTGWNDAVTVAGFNPTLGVLEAVNVTLVGGLSASIAVENLGSAGTVTATEQALVTLDRPDGSSVAAAAPSVVGGATLAGFDGSEDFAGPSGSTQSGLQQQQTVTGAFQDPASLAEFTGAGSVVLPVTALGVSNLSGPGNLLASLQATAGAEVMVSYTYVPCFAAGTRIRTPHGDVAVEALRPGDRVKTLSGESVPVVWTGCWTVELAGHPRPWDVNPVHILPHAFGAGRPHRELVLSPDHAVFADGVLVPIRHLLNGATIVQRPADRVTWHHVELARHDVLLAEGLPAESYLDTGNRAGFAKGVAAVPSAEFARAVWARAACAPLIEDGPLVYRLRARLLACAGALGFGLTDDPDLRLAVDQRILWPARMGATYAFTLPPDTTVCRLLSRSAVPAEIRPADRDRRRLGVAVACIRLAGTEAATLVPGSGWYEPEPDCRWTDGNAALHLTGVRRLEVDLLPLLGYWLPPLRRRLAA